MKSTLIMLLSLIAMDGFSQIATVWKGNTPGLEQDWGHPGNWSNNAVPDEFADVIIPFDITGADNYPVIKSGKIEIHSLCIWPGGKLIMKSGELTIVDPGKNFYSQVQIIGKPKIRMIEEAPLTSDELAQLKVD